MYALSKILAAFSFYIKILSLTWYQPAIWFLSRFINILNITEINYAAKSHIQYVCVLKLFFRT